MTIHELNSTDEPINEDVGTVEVTYSYSDGDKDYDTGYIVQYADRYEVQSDLNMASGKTIEEMKANFEKEVEINLDYDVEDLFFDWDIEEGLQESKKKVNEAVEDYIHPELKVEAEYVPTVYYACYTLDNEGYEDDHFGDFDLFEDAVSACKQKTNDTHQATHICVIIDEQDDEAVEFKRSYRLSNYEVVAEFSPDAEDILTEAKRVRESEEEVYVGDALELAFPDLDQEVFDLLFSWYQPEFDEDDYSSNQEFAEDIKKNIFRLLDDSYKYDEDEAAFVAKALVGCGFCDESKVGKYLQGETGVGEAEDNERGKEAIGKWYGMSREDIQDFAENSSEYWAGDDSWVEGIVQWLLDCNDEDVWNIVTSENIDEDDDTFLMDTFMASPYCEG